MGLTAARELLMRTPMKRFGNIPELVGFGDLPWKRCRQLYYGPVPCR